MHITAFKLRSNFFLACIVSRLERLLLLQFFFSKIIANLKHQCADRPIRVLVVSHLFYKYKCKSVQFDLDEK